MQWTEEYATGHKEIDDQHKSLFSFSDQFREVMNEGEGAYGGFLEFLEAYVEIHFGFEEECMHAHKCPVACQNKEEHRQFLTLVEQEIEEHKRIGFNHQRVEGLLDEIDRWLASHICRIDIQLKYVINPETSETG